MIFFYLRINIKIFTVIFFEVVKLDFISNIRFFYSVSFGSSKFSLKSNFICEESSSFISPKSIISSDSNSSFSSIKFSFSISFSLVFGKTCEDIVSIFLILLSVLIRLFLSSNFEVCRKFNFSLLSVFLLDEKLLSSLLGFKFSSLFILL